MQQGGVLSPVLISVGMTSLPAPRAMGSIPAFPTDMAVYADDVALWEMAWSCRRRTMVRKLQWALEKVVRRHYQLGLAMLPEKPKTLFKAPRLGAFSNTLKIMGKAVPCVGRATYLGVQKTRAPPGGQR